MAALDEFEDASEAPVATRPGGKIDLKSLPDGDYRFRVTGMRDKKVGKEIGRVLVEIDLEVAGDSVATGALLDQVYWLNKSDGTQDTIAFNRLRKDLETLGFDVPNWKPSAGRSFAKEFAKAVNVIKGVEFDGKKVTKGGYANLYINARAEDDGKPAKFGPEELDAGEELDPFDG